ncbi:MAG TPA: GIY-YIG nuclease family protein [bacterium]|nr:GIY-YIG nuclease family protein [bacterium]
MGYIIQSIANPEQVYTGYTTDVLQRVSAHNKGDSVYTSKYRPWRLRTYFAFDDKELALSFERYLKTCSGRAFMHKRLLKI